MAAIRPVAPTNLSDADTLVALRSASNLTDATAGMNDIFTPPTSIIVCYSPTMITSSGIWQGDNPLNYTLPLFVLQIVLVVLVTRGLHSVLARFRQPRFVAEVLGGIILGPSVFGRIPNYIELMFPTRSMSVLETVANLGLVYFIFLVGLHVDISAVCRAGQKAWAITVAGSAAPFFVQFAAFYLFGYSVIKNEYYSSYIVFIGVSTTITAYPVLVRILAELKLLNTEIGKVAMSSAILNNGIAWILLAIAIAVGHHDRSWLRCGYIILSSVVFVAVLYQTVRPAANWIMARTQEGEVVDDVYVMAVLLAVLVSGIVADAVGIHAVFGAFTMGVMVPKGPLVAVLMEKLEDFVSGFLLPLFFAVVGVQLDTGSLVDPMVYGFAMSVVFLSAVTRVATVVLVTMFYGVPTREGFSLGILMNTKGIMELIVLHIALDKKVILTQSYSAMILASVFLTALVTPLTMTVHRPSRQLVSYKRRTIQLSKPEAELRVMACVHGTRNVPAVISLLDISHPSKRSPIFVYALHLVELTDRESAMLIVNDTQKGEGRYHHRHTSSQPGNLNRIQAQSEQIVKAFECYEQHAGGVSVQPLTVASAYHSMHEDICSLAESKHATLLILPFHKQHNVDGGMEVTNAAIRTVNENVLRHSPCSVGILVDRGLGGSSRVAAGLHSAHHIAVLFIGGPDDREALAYAARMADHPGISLTLLRFLDAEQSEDLMAEHQAVQVLGEQDKERAVDDECVKEFRIRTMSDESVVYMEKEVANGEETLTAIRELDGVHDLFVVGRGEGVSSPLTAGLTDWTENPELGAIGDLLSSEDFSTTASVLVIQQYKGAAQVPDGSVISDSPDHSSRRSNMFGWASGSRRVGS